MQENGIHRRPVISVHKQRSCIG